MYNPGIDKKVCWYRCIHGVWKSQIKSLSTLQAKRDRLTFWVVQCGEFLKTWSLGSNSVIRKVSFNRANIGRKCPQNAIFRVIFKHCDVVSLGKRYMISIFQVFMTLTDGGAIFVRLYICFGKQFASWHIAKSYRSNCWGVQKLA